MICLSNKRTNWDKLKERRPEETVLFRDVYEEQQLDRSYLQPKKTMSSRILADVALTIVHFLLFYIVASLLQAMFLTISGETQIGDLTNVNGGLQFFGYCLRPTFGKVLLDIVFSGVFYFIMYLILKHNLDAQNQLYDMSDINSYHNDQHVALPSEIQRKFDWFPDVGATSDVQVSSMISHMALSNKGLRPVMQSKRYENDVLDEDGNVLYYKGEEMRDENDDIIFEEKPMIDIPFMNELFDASGLPKDKQYRKFYNTTMIPYNPDGSDRDKLGKFTTVADLINADWQLPAYEPQRPGGAYLVDTAPVNTMV